VGARIYHLITSWDEVPDEWWGPFAVWEGGLGVWGGIGAGVLVGAFIAHRSGANVPLLMDCVAPGLLVAQAIGRIGNWWNQELFGEPTSRPWGLEIDTAHRPDEYLFNETFHPTFLYEALWNLLAAALLLVLDRRFRFKPPALFALYVMLYTGFRFYLESLRIDPSGELAGLRTNAWVSLVVFVLASVFFVWWQFLRGRRRRPREHASAPPRAMAVPRGRVRRPR
jgi:prolipoprotein diacylglyceryl transferase